MTEVAWTVIAPLRPTNSGQRGEQWRRLAPRYETRAASYRAMVAIASIVIWLDIWLDA